MTIVGNFISDESNSNYFNIMVFFLQFFILKHMIV